MTPNYWTMVYLWGGLATLSVIAGLVWKSERSNLFTLAGLSIGMGVIWVAIAHSI